MPDAAQVGGVDVVGDPARVLACAGRVEAVDVEPELARRSGAGRRAERVLMREQQVVHLPERALLVGRLRRLRGQLRVRVHVGERQVPPDVADVAEVARAARARPARPARSRGTRSRRTRRASRARPAGRGRGRAPGRPASARSTMRLGRRRAARAAAAASGSSAVAAEDQPGQQRGAQSAALRMPSFASSSSAPCEGERGDQQRDREADPGDRAAAARPPPSRPAAAAGRG